MPEGSGRGTQGSDRDHGNGPRGPRWCAHPALTRRAGPARAARRPHRAGRAQRRRQDHDAAHPGGRERAVRRVGHPHRRNRLPATGSERGRPRRAGPRPGAVGARTGRAADRSGEAAGADGRGRRRRRARPRDPPLRAAGGAFRGTGRLRRRKRSRPHLRESRPARTGADAAVAHAVRWSAAPGGAGAHPVRRVGRRSRSFRFVDRRCCSTSRPTTSTRIRLAGCGISCAPTPAGWWSSATTSS